MLARSILFSPFNFRGFFDGKPFFCHRLAWQSLCVQMRERTFFIRDVCPFHNFFSFVLSNRKTTHLHKLLNPTQKNQNVFDILHHHGLGRSDLEFRRPWLHALQPVIPHCGPLLIRVLLNEGIRPWSEPRCSRGDHSPVAQERDPQQVRDQPRIRPRVATRRRH